MFKIDNCGLTALIGLSNLSMTGPTGTNGPIGVQSYVQNYIITPKSPYTRYDSEPVPVNVELNPENVQLFGGVGTHIDIDIIDESDTLPYIVTSTHGNAKGIKRKVFSQFNPPQNHDEILIGQTQQPTQGILYYTLGPLNLTRSTLEFFPNYLEIHIPFQVEYNTVSYNKIYVYNTSYVTFGEPFDLTNTIDWEIGVNGFNPPIPTIFIATGVTYAEPFYIYHGLENGNSTFRVRYEGYRDYEFTISIIWEIVFYRNEPSRIDISTEVIDFFGITGLTGGNGFLADLFLPSNSGVTCRPHSTDYNNINITSNNITDEQVVDDLNIQINSINPLIAYKEAKSVLFLIVQNDVLECASNLILQSPYNTTISSALNILVNTVGGDISFTPTFESTEGAGGYVSITNPLITQDGVSNIEIDVDGFCKLV